MNRLNKFLLQASEETLSVMFSLLAAIGLSIGVACWGLHTSSVRSFGPVIILTYAIVVFVPSAIYVARLRRDPSKSKKEQRNEQD